MLSSFFLNRYMTMKERSLFQLEMASVLLIILFSVMSSSQTLAGQESILETYIVLLRKPENLATDLDSWYTSFYPDQQRLVHSYKNVVHGFSARLTAEEVKALEDREGFVLARPQRLLALHTTHSPEFMGLRENFGSWNSSYDGKGVIIGVLDTGITPGHPSFNDEGMPPPPAKWKGKCEFVGGVCNRKLIGARNFVPNETLPVDKDGHGTHTASTAGGSPVEGANALGQANGTAIGMAPLAHLAIYRVCYEERCPESVILAAMDVAVEDGVDVLSLSIGGDSLPFYTDAIALGAFGAMESGIFVSCSAGNSGPGKNTLSNDAPWILTVGASTIDRTIIATVVLGSKEQYDGESLFQPQNFPSEQVPLVYAGATSNASSAWCGPGSLKDLDVKGKVVLCLRGGQVGRIDKGQEVKANGGIAMILMNDEPNGYSTVVDAHILPASHVSFTAGSAILSYINSTPSPTATIVFKGTVIGKTNAPQLSSFSSRGPSMQSPGILKPDVIGPGVSILAAWPFPIDNNTNSKATFNMISGTSMSCPHLSGIAALVKSAHPSWSPSAIKSAIMTTTRIHDLDGNVINNELSKPATLFDIGSGHVNPIRVIDPGLIYNIRPIDYIPYLCGLGYSDKQVGLIVGKNTNCSDHPNIPEAQLNYPSFSIRIGSIPLTYTRILTNVGRANMTYVSEIIGPNGVDISVKPQQIVFKEMYEEFTYSVTFTRRGYVEGNYSHGYLTWKADAYDVRTPIAVLFE